jgi:Flp pilus assembly protein TadD
LDKPGDPHDRARREASLKTALRVSPMFPNAHAALARLLLETDGRAAEAANSAARASVLDPGVVYYRVLLWQAFQRMGEKEKAARVEAPLRRAALADPETLAELAAHLDEIGKVAEAEALLVSAQATNPVAADLLESFYGDHERWDEALVLARGVLAKNPSSPSYQNLVAYRLAQAGRGLDEALDLIGKALKKQPKNPAYLDTKGVVLFRMKRLAEAELALRDALALYEDPEVLDHLADVLDARGKRTEALQLYDRALEMPAISPRVRDRIQGKVNAARGVPASG